MFKKYIKFFLILFLSVLALITPSYSAMAKENVPASSYTDNGYIIENYDVNIKVNEDNSLHIVETIEVDFKEKRHGIYRDIPLINLIKHSNGSTTSQRVKVENIDVNDNYKVTKSSGELSIKIGSSNVELIGKKTYVIEYDYIMGKDYSKEYDELYFNIIGTEWTTTIKKVTFTIEMPKEFDSSKIGFSMGYEGTIGYDNLKYEVNDNVITGYTTATLLSHQGLTIRLELPENYFSLAESLWKNNIILAIVIPLSLFLVLLIIVWSCSNSNKFLPTVEFYPPKELDSLEVGLLYKGYIIEKDTVSLIVYLASKGYITIEEQSSRSITITKLKNYDGDNHAIKTFMSLFMPEDIIQLTSKTNDSFVSVISSIKAHANTKTASKYFLSKAKTYKVIAYVLGVIALVLPSLILTGDSIMLAICIFPAIGVFFLLSVGIKTRNYLLLGFSIFWGLTPYFALLAVVYPYGLDYLIISALGLIYALIISLVLIPKISFKTEEGGRLYAQVMGFRKFIKMVKKEELELLCLKNPSYYYDILPYAYVLGVSNVWIKKFEHLTVAPVDWYKGYHGSIFSIQSFSTISHSVSRSSSSGGSGSSGGGSSGGGSGGGGGGSW